MDGEVEVFDDQGKATGLLFLVQLKATDEPELSRALGITLTVEVFRYYQSLALPVLLVRWHSYSKRVFARWVHRFDPYYGGQGQKTFTFRFEESDEWLPETPKKLVSEIQARQIFGSPNLRIPVRFTLETKIQSVDGVPAGQIAISLRRAIGETNGLLEIVSADKSVIIPSISVEPDKFVVDLAGYKTITIHTSYGYSESEYETVFPYDVLATVAVALASAGHSSLADNIGRIAISRSKLIEIPELGVFLALAAARLGLEDQAIQYIEPSLNSEDTAKKAEFLLFSAAFVGGLCSAGESGLVRQFLGKRLASAIAFGDPIAVSVAHYNLGNKLRGRGNELDALAHYRKAARADPTYWRRPYFLREIAGILFNSKRYTLAARLYGLAIGLGETDNCAALYADALMFSGRYREAEESFDTYLRASGDPTGEWRLKSHALNFLRAELQISEQKRDCLAARRTATTVDPSENQPDAPEVLHRALMADALCGEAWMRIAHMNLNAERIEPAFFPSLLAGLTLRTDTVAWYFAFNAALFSKKYIDLLPAIMDAAYFINGESFLDVFSKASSLFPKEFPKGDYLDLINSLVNSISREWNRRPFELRLLGPGSSFRVLKAPK